MEFNETNVAEAIRQFYGTADANIRRQLNHWLTEAQNSVAVWRFAWNLLDANVSSNDLAVQHFAASCLHRKLSTNQFDEYLKTASIGNAEFADKFLRDSLIDHCSRAKAKLVRNKLASALAAYIVYSTPDIWPNALFELCTLWKSTRSALLMDVFGSIPNECGTMTMDIARKPVVRGALRNQESIIANTSSELLQLYRTDGEMVDVIVKCVEAWIDFCNDASEWVTIVGVCLQCAVDVGSGTMSAVSKFFCRFMENSELRKLDNFVGQLFDFFSHLLLRMSNSEVDELEDVIDMCIALLENHSSYLLKQLSSNESALNLIQAALNWTNTSGFYSVDETASVKTFNMWYNLYEDASAEQDSTVRNGSLKIIEPLYFQLANVLLSKLKYPSDLIYKEWSAEDKENFEKYRTDGADVFACCYRILVSTDFFDILVGDKFKQALDVLTSSNGVNWEGLEMILYSLESIGDYVTSDHFSLKEFMKCGLPSIPFSSPVLANTALRLVAKYAHIIGDDMNMLKPILNDVVIRFLNNPATVYNATLALEFLSRYGDVVLANDQPLCLAVISSASQCFHNVQFQRGDQLRALSAIGYVLSIQPREIIITYLNDFVAPRLQRLQDVVDGKTAPCTKAQLLMEFDILTCLISTLGSGINRRSNGISDDSTNNPVFLLISQSFGLFENVYVVSGGDSDVAKKIVDTLKRSLVNLTDDAADLVPRYRRILELLYPPHTIALDLTKPLFLLFGNNTAISTQMVSIFDTLSEKTASFDNSDGVEAFLGLCHQLAKKQRNFLLNNVSAVSLERSVVIACHAIGNRSSHSSVVRQSSLFLCELFSNADSSHITELAQKYSTTLMASCFERLQVELLGSCVEYVADIIFNLFKLNQQNTDVFLRQNMETNPLILAMMKEIGNKRKFREYAKQFNFTCRRESQNCVVVQPVLQ